MRGEVVCRKKRIFFPANDPANREESGERLFSGNKACNEEHIPRAHPTYLTGKKENTCLSPSPMRVVNIHFVSDPKNGTPTNFDEQL
jgi:hypothetical protein